MTKRKFIDWKPKKKERIQKLRHAIDIIEEYADQGYDLSVRQLYYQMVARNLIPNNKDEYRKIVDIVKMGRRAGYIDWDMIVDRGRSLDRSAHFNSASDIITMASKIFKLDRWEDQENRVYVMVEKDALSGVLGPVCEKLDVPFTAMKGYSSESHLYKIAREIRAYVEGGQRVYMLYLGDHDPSGLDMDRDIGDRIRLLGGLNDGEVNRLALTFEQIEELKPPPNYAKVTDSRAKDYISQYGESSWELDAIDPPYLAALVETHIRKHLDEDLYDARVELEKQISEELELIAYEVGEE